MATKLADRVKETSTTTGTGTYSLAGAVTGFQAFSDAFATTDVVYYCAEDGANWEVGEGTLTTGTPWTLARTTIFASSNADAAVNWAAGTRNIFCTAPQRAVTPYYAEGDWTPAVSAATPGTLSVTYTAQVGKYTRIGRAVHASFYIAINTFTLGSASGEVRITGLPFTSTSTANTFHVGSVAVSGGPDIQATTVTLAWRIVPGVTYLQLLETLDNTSAALTAIGAIAAGDGLYGNITYIVD